MTWLVYLGAALVEIAGCFAIWGWLWVAECVRPDRWDLIGAAICLVGASVILFGPRSVVAA